jgi:hypothetical protein
LNFDKVRNAIVAISKPVKTPSPETAANVDQQKKNNKVLEKDLKRPQQAKPQYHNEEINEDGNQDDYKYIEIVISDESVMDDGDMEVETLDNFSPVQELETMDNFPPSQELDANDNPSPEELEAIDNPSPEELEAIDDTFPEESEAFDNHSSPQEPEALDNPPPEEPEALDNPPPQEPEALDNPSSQESETLDNPPPQESDSFDNPPPPQELEPFVDEEESSPSVTLVDTASAPLYEEGLRYLYKKKIGKFVCLYDLN